MTGTSVRNFDGADPAENNTKGARVNEAERVLQRALVERDRGALFALSHSGGKDSQAMTLLVAHHVPARQIVVVHAPLERVEWSGTVEHIRRTIPRHVPFVEAKIANGKTLLDRVRERRMWPDPQRRWCTSGHYGVHSIVAAMTTRSLWRVEAPRP